MGSRDRNNRDIDDSGVAPNSRLFIICDKRLTEEQFRDVFSEFGTIEDIHMPRDHNTNEPKGIVYLQFYKTSEAAKALEEMNLKTIPGSNSLLKIMVAANRSDIQQDDYDEERYKRLFLHVPKSATEETLLNEFSQFGHIESVIIQRDRSTGESKGFAYVKFRKFSEAANALEQCKRHYRPIFAIPKSQKRRHETSFETNINSLANTSRNMRSSLIPMMNTAPRGFTRVNFICSPYLTQRHVERFFDLIPGLTYCRYFVDLMQNHGKGTAEYSSPVSAAYAVEKLNNFEYPPGLKIFVKPNNSYFEGHEINYTNIPNVVSKLKNAIAATANSTAPDLAQLADAVAEATKLIKLATGGVAEERIPDSDDINYCSVKLPPPQPLADIDSPVAKRCFLICKPSPPPTTVLRDIFCRFGNLINVYTLPNRTVGFARYAVEESADKAMQTLHGAEICGVRIKVVEAEEEAPPKRSRYE